MSSCSVIVPAYNAENMLERCIKSIKKQNYNGHIEIIVVDDASTDKTAFVARNMGAILISHTRNLGPSQARNSGIERASGKYIAFLDSDDIAKPDWLITSISFFEKKIVGVGCSHDLLNKTVISELSWLDQMVRHQRLKKYTNHVGGSGSVWLKNFLIEVNGFEIELRCAEDAEITKKAIDKSYKVVFTPKKLIKVTHKGNLQSFVKTQTLKVAYYVYFKSYINKVGSKSKYFKEYSGLLDLIQGIAPLLLALLIFLYQSVYVFMLFMLIILLSNIKLMVMAYKQKGIFLLINSFLFLMVRSISWSIGILWGGGMTICKFIKY